MSQTEPAPQFIHPLQTFQSLVELGFIGEPIALDLYSGFIQTDGTTRGTMKLLLFLAFSILYCNYIIMSLVLLLNLLIAMMSTTYASVIESSTLQWRLDFARLVGIHKPRGLLLQPSRNLLCPSPGSLAL